MSVCNLLLTLRQQTASICKQIDNKANRIEPNSKTSVDPTNKSLIFNKNKDLFVESTDVFELASIGNQTVGPVGRFDPPARSLIKKSTSLLPNS